MLAVGVVAMINNTSSSPSDSSASAVAETTPTPGGGGTPSGIVTRSVTVSGHGKVTVKPDTASLSLGVSVTASKANDALRQAANKADTLIKVLTSAGVSKDDITTSGVSLYPQYDNTGRTITGYNASNNMTVTIRKLGDAGTIIDAAAALVGNEINIGGISFYVNDTEAVLGAARAAAIVNAKARADQYAGAANAKVGAVMTISEVSSPVTGPIYYQNAAADLAGLTPSSTPVSPGTQDLTIDVTVVYELK
jgi:uncharacterized protein YggE